MAGARRPPVHTIPALTQMLEAGLAVLDPRALAGAVEDLAEVLFSRVWDVYLARQASQHNLSQHLVRLVRAGEDQQRRERYRKLSAVDGGDAIHAVGERLEQPIEQVVHTVPLAAQVVNQQHAASGFELDGAIVVALIRVEMQVELIEPQLD